MGQELLVEPIILCARLSHIKENDEGGGYDGNHMYGKEVFAVPLIVMDGSVRAGPKSLR